MAETQLRLFPAPRPLVERLGAEFFRGIPRSPGVYRMFDTEGRLLYVGKARDLRARLASYRRTQGQAWRTIRLLHTARRIDFEVCADETAARLLENELIRTLRPPFNRAGTWPRSARYVILEERADGFVLRVEGEPDAESYGAFRGGAGMAMASLARLFWLAWHRASEVTRLPHALAGREVCRRFESRHGEACSWLTDLRRFLGAEDDALLARLIAAVPEPMDGFGRLFVAAQFEMLTAFYRQGPARNRRLIQSFRPEEKTLRAEILDDLLIRAGPTLTAPLFRPEAAGPGSIEGVGSIRGLSST